MTTLPPLPAPVAVASTDDLAHLRLLAVFHYVVAGLTALFALIPSLHLALGIAVVSGAIPAEDPDARWVGWFFIVFAAVFILCGLGLAAAMAFAGRNLQRHRGHTYCLVVAGLSCMVMPFGTVLGVFTLIVLLRPGVRALFEGASVP
ncbi:MAG TPA: hypothetical protein VIP30_03580 [Stenotrophomonas sp.]